AVLFREWWRVARQAPGLWRVAFSASDPVNTPSGLKIGDPKLRARFFDALDQAAATLRSAGFALDVPLGEVQHRQTASGPVPLHGGDEIEGVLNRVESAGAGGLAPGGLEIAQGSSYLQAVTFDERGPLAEGLLVYGQSSQPGSPHAFDQLPLFAQKQWPVLPFHPEDVAKARVGSVLSLALAPKPPAVPAPNPIPIPPPLPSISASAPAQGSRTR
ncbi:MAG TPA: penicillin acylase family protein, partial [Ideonella sp.]|nr:penicillin acylase family protein [Ideonella sp.]